MDKIIFRLITPNLFTRAEAPKNGTFLDLKKNIEETTKIPINQQQLFYDLKFINKIKLSNRDPISKLKLKEGEPIFLQNAHSHLSDSPKKPSKEEEEEKPKCNHGENETCINCIDLKNKKLNSQSGNASKTNTTTNNLISTSSNDTKNKSKNVPINKQSNDKDNNQKQNQEKELTALEKDLIKQGLTPNCTHPPGQKCIHCMETPAYKGELKYTCQHGPDAKCPNCVGKEFISDAKHKSFNQYLNERKEKCKGTHEQSTICINCMPPSVIEYKMKKDCPNHPPYPLGCCNKCMPPNAILNRQVYRHVDYVSFMNKEEIEIFLQPFIKGYFQTPRMAFLFGYYAKDPNYPDGVRCIVEALYEPPQIADNSTVIPKVDKNCEKVGKIFKAMGMDIVGWIFTSLDGNKNVCLSAYDMRKAAKLQQEYLIDHESGIKISRFITCVVKPNDLGECNIEVYMVSDMCQALERDNILGNIIDDKKLVIRKAEKNEMLPTVFMESKPCTEFDPDFFIVNIGHGVPNDKKNMNILKTYDFPCEFRTEKGIVTTDMIKNYFKKYKKEDPNVKCANFYFLLYLSKVFDVDTACTYATQVLNGKIEWEILGELLRQYIGNI